MADELTIMEAIQWRLRLRSGLVEDWEAFTLWLEGDPARAAVYDEVALAEIDADEALPMLQVPPAANDDDDGRAQSLWRTRWIGALVATLIAALIGFMALPKLTAGEEFYTIATAKGEHRLVQLGAGNMIALNGQSRLTLRKGDEHFASLEAGEALFSIRHNAQNPFELSIGDDRIRDVGTRFNVIKDPSSVRIAVGEGTVLFNPDGEAVTLVAGQGLRHMRSAEPVVHNVDSSAVGAWRKGRLAYREAPLADVVADLSRALGKRVSADQRVANRSFTGVLQIERDPAALVNSLGMLLDLQVRSVPDGWQLMPRGRAAD